MARKKTEAGTLSVVGRLPTPADDQYSNILVRVPKKLLSELDAHLAGARSPAVAALIAVTVDRLLAGEDIQLQSGEILHWFE